MRLVVMFDNFGPYHLARLAATRACGRQEGITVYGLETKAKSVDYHWMTGKEADRNHIDTIFPGDTSQSRVGLGAYPRIWQALNRIQPDFLALPGYRDLAAMTAFLWAKTHGKITVMMSDSTYEDKPRNFWVEYFKRQIVSRFDGALVAGSRQKEYIVFLGIPADRVFLGYDVVDNDYFDREAKKVRRRGKYYRQALGLPQRYFLAVSRFIAKKNLCGLIQAYAEYRCLARGKAWDLVICGSGPLEEALKRQAGYIPGIHFPGFTQIDTLPRYYGLASAFILPSSHFEQWGLVVNEAMASGLPVLVSAVCGCATELVQEGVNGFTFDPFDLEGLARLLVKVSSGKMDLKAMGQASLEIVADFTPEVFAHNLLQAVEAGRAASALISQSYEPL